MLKTKTLAILALAGGSLVLTGCRTNAQTGSLLGAGLGTALGSAIGYHNGNRNAGMLIGGAVGALGGYAIGNEVDKDQRGARYDGDPRYEPGYERYDDGGRGYVRRRVRYYDDCDAPPRERVIYRERTIYERDCEPCR
jgi:hypothetical protein